MKTRINNDVMLTKSLQGKGSTLGRSYAHYHDNTGKYFCLEKRTLADFG